MPNRTFFSDDDIVNGKLCISDNQNDIYNLTYRFLYTNQSTSQDHYAIVAESSGSCLSVKFVDAVMPQETRFINHSERCSGPGLCFFVLDEDNFDLYFDTTSNCISSGYESSVVTSVSGIPLSGEPILTLLESSSDPSTPGLSSALGWYEFNSGTLTINFDDLDDNTLSTSQLINACSNSTDHTLSLFFIYNNLSSENHHLIIYKDGDCTQTETASGCSDIISETISAPTSSDLLVTLFGRNENGNLNFIILSETNYDAFVTNNCIACSATVTSATSSMSATENIYLEEALVEIGVEGVITPINESTDEIGKLYLDIEDINFPGGTTGGGGGPGEDPEDNNNCCGQIACIVPGPVVYCPKPSITVGFNVDNFNFANVSFEAPDDPGGVMQTTDGGQTATFTWVNSPQDGSSLPITITYTGGCIDGVTDIVFETEIESVKETTVTNANVSRISIEDGVGCEFVVTISVGYDPKLEDQIPNSLEQFQSGNTFWRLCNANTTTCSLGGLLGGFTRVGNAQVSDDGLLIVDYEFVHNTICTDRVIRYDDIQLFLLCYDGLTVISDLSEQSCPCCMEVQP